MNSVFRYIDKSSQYYPTPEYLIKTIMRYFKFNTDLPQTNVLEPCAGDGSICEVIKERAELEKVEVNISCIEIEDILRNHLKSEGYNVVGSDFEQFNSVPFYDLIVMNPPFNKGAKFLLKAYNLLNSDGQLICILNAETIRNPCNKDREILKSLIERNGQVEFIEGAFRESEHKTEVEIAVVYLKRPIYENEFDLFGNVQENILTDKELYLNSLKQNLESTGLVTIDKVENAIGVYRGAVKQIFEGIEAINNIKSGLLYLKDEAEEFNIDINKFVEIMLKESPERAREQSVTNIRKMAWSYILKFCDMEQYLYSRQKQDFYKRLEKGASVLPFTKMNISQFFDNIMLSKKEFFDKGIEDLFEHITSKYNGNPYYAEGWKTNKNWKINKKMIVDSWGLTWDTWKGSSGRFRLSYYSDRYEWMNDLDKAVRIISPENRNGFTIKEALEQKFKELGEVCVGQKFDNVVHTPYFRVKFWKKGTLHIEFKDKNILDELNRIGGSLRKDLGYDY